jgi:hypothetical protein
MGKWENAVYDLALSNNAREYKIEFQNVQIDFLRSRTICLFVKNKDYVTFDLRIFSPKNKGSK